MHFTAWVVQGPRVDGELLTFLLKKNADLMLGGLGLDDQGDVSLTHGVLASTLDDPIRDRWGGQRSVEPPAEGAVAAEVQPISGIPAIVAAG